MIPEAAVMVEGTPKQPESFTQGQNLHYLKNFTEFYQQNDRRKRIAIIGAGMAGLTCGWLLSRAGHDVSIFEASNVVGGRVKTLRDRFTSGLYAEAGAMRIPKNHRLTDYLVKYVLGEELEIG